MIPMLATTRQPLRTAAGFVAAAILALTPCLPATAQEADLVLRDFEPTGDFVLEVDGEVAKGAEIYKSDRVAALLLVTSKLPAPTLLQPRVGSIETVSLMKLARRDDGSIDILADAELTPAGRFELDGEVVRFTIGDKQAALKPRPWLLGLQPAEKLLDDKPEYERDAAAYQPDGTALTSLRQATKDVRVRVYFGSWCPACSRSVPPLLKVAEELAGSDIDFEFYGLPRPFDGEPAAEADDVHGVPTGIVYVDGKEAGRLYGGPAWRFPELTLNDIVQGRYSGS